MAPHDPDAFLRAIAASPKREQRQRIAKGLAVVRAAKKAGLSVKGATVEGVTLELGESDAAKATLTPLEAWKAKHARST